MSAFCAPGGERLYRFPQSGDTPCSRGISGAGTQGRVDTLILGCTHYPVIREIIADIMGADVTLISPGAEAAKFARKCLTEQNLLTDSDAVGENTYYVSDSPEMFMENAGNFLGENVAGKVFHTSLQI